MMMMIMMMIMTMNMIMIIMIIMMMMMSSSSSSYGDKPNEISEQVVKKEVNYLYMSMSSIAKTPSPHPTLLCRHASHLLLPCLRQIGSRLTSARIG